MNKSKKVYDIFQNISPYYDRANDRISLGLQKKRKNKFVSEVLKTINEDSDLLDLCCGFRVIIVIEANIYVNIRSSRLLPKFKTQKINSWCAA